MFKFKRIDDKIVLPRRQARDLPGDEGVCRGYAVSKLEEYVAALEQIVSTLASKSQADAVDDNVAAARHAAEKSEQWPQGDSTTVTCGDGYDPEAVHARLSREGDLIGSAVDGQD